MIFTSLDDAILIQPTDRMALISLNDPDLKPEVLAEAMRIYPGEKKLKITRHQRVLRHIEQAHSKVDVDLRQRNDVHRWRLEPAEIFEQP